MGGGVCGGAEFGMGQGRSQEASLLDPEDASNVTLLNTLIPPHTPPPLPSITAPRPPRKGSANAAGTAKETASVYSVTHRAGSGRDSAPGLGARPWGTSAVLPRATLASPAWNRHTVGPSGCWRAGLLCAGCRQNRGASCRTLEERRKGAASWMGGAAAASEKARGKERDGE